MAFDICRCFVLYFFYTEIDIAQQLSSVYLMFKSEIVLDGLAGLAFPRSFANLCFFFIFALNLFLGGTTNSPRHKLLRKLVSL